MSTLYRRVTRLEQRRGLDRASAALTAAAERLTAHRRLRSALSGTWLGHALHPVLTDFPLGSWMSASFLDLFGPRGSEPAAERLLTFGLLAAVPTAAAGLVDWNDSQDGPRRAGVVHATVNTTATVLYATSLLLRRRGRHTSAVAVGVAGGVVATVGGYVGGHLSLARGVGVDHTAFDAAPHTWTPVADGIGPADSAVVAGVRIVVAGPGDERSAVVGRCTRCRSQLLVTREGLTCPHDGSRFDRRSGAVLAGPATTPLARLDVRRRGDVLEARWTRPSDAP